MNDVLIRMIQHHPHCNCTGRVCGYACLEQRELAKMLYLCPFAASPPLSHICMFTQMGNEDIPQNPA